MISEFSNNYSQFGTDKVGEVTFAEELKNWKGTIIDKAYEIILQLGSERAKEIVQKGQSAALKKKEETVNKEQQQIKNEFATSDIVGVIASLRTDINKRSIADGRFGYSILSPNEDIYQQNKPAHDEVSLRGYCLVLRTTIQGFDKNITNITLERIQKQLPEINLPGSINKFHCLLLELGVDVDYQVCGLRDLNKIVDKLAHPGENEREVHQVLGDAGLKELYVNNEWSKLHREILLRYKQTLESLDKLLFNSVITG
jgi:hypothetical protein